MVHPTDGFAEGFQGMTPVRQSRLRAMVLTAKLHLSGETESSSAEVQLDKG